MMLKRQYGGLLFDPTHYERLAWVETRHNAKSENPLQITLPAFQELQRYGYFKDRSFNSLTPSEALAGGMKYASILGQMGFSNEHWNAAAYNMGPTKARALFKKYNGDIKQALQDKEFPQTTRNYLYDYTLSKVLKDRQPKEDQIKKMYDLIINNADVNQLETPKEQTGGPVDPNVLFKTNKKAYVDQVLKKAGNLEWVQRLTDDQAPVMHAMDEPASSISTHLMSDNGQGYVYPRIIGDHKGGLLDLGEGAYRYALATDTGLQLPKTQGSWFAANGYKQGTNVMRVKKQTGGQTQDDSVYPFEKPKKYSWWDMANSGKLAPAGAALTGFGDITGLQGNIAGGTVASTLGGLFTGGPLGAALALPLSLMKYASVAGAKADAEEEANRNFISANTVQPETGRVASFEKGGMKTLLNSNVSYSGYREDSKDNKNPFNVIPSNRISMANVGGPIKGFAFKGDQLIEARTMYPGEEHKFDGATKVLEVPLLSDKVQQILSKYGKGGEAPQVVPAPSLVPLQTSKDEMVIHPNYDVTKVAARKTHAQYASSGDSNKVTDTLTPLQTDEMGNAVSQGAYVVSADKDLKITKKLAERIGTGIKPAYYSEGKHLPEAENLTLASEFYGNKSSMTPVGLLKKVLDKYKTPWRDTETDTFAKSTEEAHKESRKPYLDLVKKLNDLVRGKDPDTQETPQAGKGMNVRYRQEGGDLEDFIKSRIQELKGSQYDGSSKYHQMAYNLLSGEFASAASSLQNPVNEIYGTSSELQDRKFAPTDVGKIGRVFDNSQANRDAITLKGLEDAGVSPQQSVFYLNSNRGIEQRNKAVLDANMKNEELDRRKATAEDKNQASMIGQKNQNRESLNRYLFNVTTPIASTLGNMGKIEAGDSQNKMAWENNRDNSIMNLMQSQYMMNMMDKYINKGDRVPIKTTTPIPGGSLGSGKPNSNLNTSISLDAKPVERSPLTEVTDLDKKWDYSLSNDGTLMLRKKGDNEYQIATDVLNENQLAQTHNTLRKYFFKKANYDMALKMMGIPVSRKLADANGNYLEPLPSSPVIAD